MHVNESLDKAHLAPGLGLKWHQCPQCQEKVIFIYVKAT